MTAHPRPPANALVYLLLTLSAAIAIAAVIVLVRRQSLKPDALPETAEAAAVSLAGDPILAEAGVFRTPSTGALAIDPTMAVRRAAHPRTLATYRLLRAYPGAPPRIPHGLTPAETQRGGCTACHARGGYSQRFGAYVPVTPHPELRACLQCHVGDAQLMSNPLPGTDPSARCRQCHAPGARRWRDSSLDWTPLPWPRLADKTAAHVPPPIPHSLELRGNCLACHAAPAGVAEIRTPHPERASCRQCHVEASNAAGDFVRPPPPSRGDGGAP